MDFNQIQELIRQLSKHKVSEFILKEGEFKLIIRNNSGTGESGAQAPSIVIPAAQPVIAMPQPVAAAPAPAPAPAPVAAKAAEAPAAEKAPAAASEDAKYVAIKSPMVGTFYRSPGQDKPPFVKVGDAVEVGATVCIIEAMKLFNEIESDVKGKIVKVLVDDAKPVEYEQVLFLVDPA